MRIGLAGAGRIGARHAGALRDSPQVESLVIADADPSRAREVADRLGGVATVDSVDGLFAAGLDALVVTAATDAHADLVKRGVAARIPVFCEKPIAPDVSGTIEVMETVRAAGVAVQVGFQRRFDAGHNAVRDAVASGRLGWLHTIRSCTLDPAPPPREYLPNSGGLFRDCVIHDIDAVRFVTGRDVVQVVAVGANRGDDIFRECADVDTGSGVLTLDDGTIAVASATRYNAAGYDVRLEALGAKDSIVAGLDDRTPLTRAADGRAPALPYSGFIDRFAAAYDAELQAFLELVAGGGDNRCPPEDALEACYAAEACELSRRLGRAVHIDEVKKAG
ncbi:MAG TPA: Gfo/Idh/MocA family oxidoreductase [Streptosporangiaceae bacterium]|jgi:myo-inositol 2-dehydrogenase/D-chiro-inositol 1-dehydrogenase|nr:Gfo/Idh/MocA family oxidoreductase [Streptosporangiaceae bacterium]